MKSPGHVAAAIQPCAPRRLQQGVGPDDVGVDESRRTGDRAIDVGFGGEVNDGSMACRRSKSSTRAWSRISPWTKVWRPGPDSSTRLSWLPACVRRSRVTIRQEAAAPSAWRTKCDLMKPEPPVTRRLLMRAAAWPRPASGGPQSKARTMAERDPAAWHDGQRRRLVQSTTGMVSFPRAQSSREAGRCQRRAGRERRT